MRLRRENKLAQLNEIKFKMFLQMVQKLKLMLTDTLLYGKKLLKNFRQNFKKKLLFVVFKNIFLPINYIKINAQNKNIQKNKP